MPGAAATEPRGVYVRREATRLDGTEGTIREAAWSVIVLAGGEVRGQATPPRVRAWFAPPQDREGNRVFQLWTLCVTGTMTSYV
jgi:hypothetical protein